ncbi:helix-turn-helix transcriptional regulator [Actinoallomurus vinaceus]|uniref:Helix-turn-helix transcriptional regulator n=1 Tax=Actinoallomurus vinaceus TaxID=1080074 RepID=A0ABP8TZ16_9ACTN
MSETLPPELTPGERIRVLRERRGLSRPVLANLVGRGPDWLKKIERGERELRDYTLLVRLATALRVSDLSVITGGTTPVPVDVASRLVLPFVGEIRDAVRGSLFSSPSQDDPPSVDVLRGRVSELWRLWHSSRFQRSEVGRMLPSLIRDAQASTRHFDGPERRKAYAVLADVYHLAQQALAYACEPELYWIIVDRGRFAAQEADDPVSLGGAAWTFGNGLRETGYAEEAIREVEMAANGLAPLLEDGSNDLRAMYGALHLHAAITYAREGRDGDAWRHWDEANRAVERLPANYAHAWTVFGRANVDIHGISIGVDLRTPGAALQRSEEMDLDTVPSVERRSRVLVELARAQHQRHDHAGTLHYMNRAHTASPECVRYTPLARGLVSDLVREARGPLKSDAVALADAVGVLAG